MSGKCKSGVCGVRRVFKPKPKLNFKLKSVVTNRQKNEEELEDVEGLKKDEAS